MARIWSWSRCHSGETEVGGAGARGTGIPFRCFAGEARLGGTLSTPT